MCPSSQRPQCVFQVEVPAARGRQRPLHLLCYPLYLLHDLARWAPASSSLPSVTAPTRATRRAPALAASPPPALLPRATRLYLFRAVLTKYLPHALTPYMYQAYLDATPLLFPTLASLRRTFSRG